MDGCACARPSVGRIAVVAWYLYPPGQFLTISV
jgi:hypothetical protein